MVLRVDPLVQHLPLGGETVLLPDLLDVNEGILALAEEYVLERGDPYKVILRIQEINLLSQYRPPRAGQGIRARAEYRFHRPSGDGLPLPFSSL